MCFLGESGEDGAGVDVASKAQDAEAGSLREALQRLMRKPVETEVTAVVGRGFAPRNH